MKSELRNTTSSQDIAIQRQACEYELPRSINQPPQEDEEWRSRPEVISNSPKAQQGLKPGMRRSNEKTVKNISNHPHTEDIHDVEQGE